MQNSCVSEAFSLGKPETYVFTMHIMTCFEVPVNSFGAYCILFQTPKKMESVKWPILHLICFFQDVWFSFFTTPYLQFPFLSGVSLGFWSMCAAQFFGNTILLGQSGAGILMIFENRFHILYAENSFWSKIRIPYVLLNFLLAPALLLPELLQIPEQYLAIQSVQEKIHCLLDPNTFVFSLDRANFFLLVIINGGIETIQFLVFLTILMVKMTISGMKGSAVSVKTQDLQRKFAIALSSQTLIPAVLLLFPVVYCTVAHFFDYYNQAMNNLMVCFWSAHGVLSTVIMIIVHQPYRDFVSGPVYRLTGVSKGIAPGRMDSVTVVA